MRTANSHQLWKTSTGETTWESLYIWH